MLFVAFLWLSRLHSVQPPPACLLATWDILHQRTQTAPL